MRTGIASLVGALSLTLVVAACAAPATEAVGADTAEVNASWFSAHVPSGSDAEAKVLALVNDSTMTAAKYEDECGFSPSAAANVLAYRQGDSASSTSDDQRFDSLSELDALPFTDLAFWSTALVCSSTHVSGPSLCVGPPPVIVDFVIDESSSMNMDGKWTAQRAALQALYAEFQANGDNLRIGAELFGAQPGDSVAPAPVDDVQRAALTHLVDKSDAAGAGTATDAAMARATTTVERAAALAGPHAQKVIVLLTDGQPTGGDVAKQKVLDIVTTAHAAGTSVFAVGIGRFPASGGSYDPAFLGHIAQAGGTAPAGCTPDTAVASDLCHYQITPGSDVTATKQSLVSALNHIRASIAARCP